jgi:imidazolonepropionase-like amidohydrolase
VRAELCDRTNPDDPPSCEHGAVASIGPVVPGDRRGGNLTTMRLIGAELLDGTGVEPMARRTVHIDGDLIASIDTDRTQHSDTSTLDLGGLTLMPGLIDAHAHHGIVEVHDADRSPLAVIAARIIANLARSIDAGFTTTREMGGLDGGFAQAIAAGLVPGPRLFPSGPLLCTTAGHGDLSPSYLPHPTHSHDRVAGLVQNGHPVDGTDGMRRAARDAFRHGATQLKLCISGGVVSLTDRMEDVQFSVDEMRAAVEEARDRHTYVAAHAHNVDAIRRGLEAGIHSFEHGTFLDAATAALMADAGAVLVPTLTIARVWSTDSSAVPAESRDRVAVLEAGMSNAVRLAKDFGITMGSGSDLIGPEQRGRGMEIGLKADLIGAMDAIVSATATNARILRRDDLGTIEAGKQADMIAVDGDPLADPWLLADPDRIVVVIQGGRIVKDRR